MRKVIFTLVLLGFLYPLNSSAEFELTDEKIFEMIVKSETKFFNEMSPVEQLVKLIYCVNRRIKPIRELRGCEDSFFIATREPNPTGGYYSVTEQIFQRCNKLFTAKKLSRLDTIYKTCENMGWSPGHGSSF